MTAKDFEGLPHIESPDTPADTADIILLENVAASIIDGTPLCYTQRCLIEIHCPDGLPLYDVYLTTQHHTDDATVLAVDTPETSVEIVDPVEEQSLVEVVFGADGKLDTFWHADTFDTPKVLEALDKLKAIGSGELPIADIATIVRSFVLEAVAAGVESFEADSVKDLYPESRAIGALISKAVRSSRSPVIVQRQFGHAFSQNTVLTIITTGIHSMHEENGPVPPVSYAPALRVAYEDVAGSRVVEYIQRADGRRVLYEYDPRDTTSVPPSDQAAIDEIELSSDGTCLLHPPKASVDLLLSKLFDASKPDDDEFSRLLD